MDDPVFRYDEELQMEAHFFKGLKPAFPPHFHEHYLFGLVEEGARTLFTRAAPTRPKPAPCWPSTRATPTPASSSAPRPQAGAP